MPLRKGRPRTALNLIAQNKSRKISLPVSNLTKTPKVKNEISIDLKTNKDYKWILSKVKRALPKHTKTAMPMHLKPMLSTVVSEPFNDANWLFEIKWDGYRALSYVAAEATEIRSRNNLSFATKFPGIFKALKEWPVQAVVDGEVVVVSDDGKADFEALQSWQQNQSGHLMYYVFDLLWVEGIDLQEEPLWRRKEILQKLVPEGGPIRFSDSIEEYGIPFFKAAKENGLEGIIAKQNSSTYQAGYRTQNWHKIKVEKEHEAFICGYTKKKTSSRTFSSLILGIPQGDQLLFIGQVGTGFNESMQEEIMKDLAPLITKDCPFEKGPKITDPVQWVTPKIVCDVKYTERTKEGVMRHPSFKGIRKDKNKDDLNIEIEAEPAVAKKGQQKNKLFITAAETTKNITVDDTKQTLTNLTKTYWPKEKITKGSLLNYYHTMVEYMLPYIVDRPQSLNRFPQGIDGKNFYQKNMKGKAAPWIKTFERISESAKEENDFLVCTNEASLLYMVNLGCIEINPWHSRISTPLYPDWCVIDLDPGNISFNKVIQTARVVNELLQSLEIVSFPKTSGSTGLHIYIPLGAKYNYEQSRQLAELIATLVHHELPTFTSLIRNPEKRKDKIYIDYLQNRPIQTICAPYSVRPKPGATISAPLHWEEVREGLKMIDFTMHNMHERVKSEGDLFKGVLGEGIDLNKVLKKLASQL